MGLMSKIMGNVEPGFDQSERRVSGSDDAHHESLIAAKSEIDSIDEAFARIMFTPEGTILDANDAFLGAMGYTRDEVVGKHHRMFVDPSVANTTSSLRRDADERRAAYESERATGRPPAAQSTQTTAVRSL